MKLSVADALDKYIESVTEDREPDGMYHPSSMFMCTRQVVYGVRGVDKGEGPDDVSRRRFYIGHRLHEAAQRAVESYGSVKSFYPEFSVHSDEHNVTGHGDMLVELATGEWIVVEVKSTKRWALSKKLPQEHHMNQVMLYAWGARTLGVTGITETGEEVWIPPLGEKLWGVLIVYMEKEELQIVECEIPWDDSWNGKVVGRLIELNLYRDDPKSLPPRLPIVKGKKDWQCRYCAYAVRCWKEDPDEVSPESLEGVEWE